MVSPKFVPSYDKLISKPLPKRETDRFLRELVGKSAFIIVELTYVARVVCVEIGDDFPEPVI